MTFQAAKNLTRTNPDPRRPGSTAAGISRLPFAVIESTRQRAHRLPREPTRAARPTIVRKGWREGRNGGCSQSRITWWCARWRTAPASTPARDSRWRSGHAVAGHMPHPAIPARPRSSGAGSARDRGPFDRAIGRRLALHRPEPAGALARIAAQPRQLHLGLQRIQPSTRASACAPASKPAGPGTAAPREWRAESRGSRIADPELCAVGTRSRRFDRVLRIERRATGRGPTPPRPASWRSGSLLGRRRARRPSTSRRRWPGMSAGALDQVARHLGASRRSLQRRLAEESTSFEAIRSSRPHRGRHRRAALGPRPWPRSLGAAASLICRTCRGR